MRKALSHFGTPAEVERLKTELNRTGLGNHPVMIRGLARIARLIGNAAPPKSNKEKTIAEILYRTIHRLGSNDNKEDQEELKVAHDMGVTKPRQPE